MFFFVFYGCEQRADFQNILPCCRLNLIKIISRLQDLKKIVLVRPLLKEHLRFKHVLYLTTHCAEGKGRFSD